MVIPKKITLRLQRCPQFLVLLETFFFAQNNKLKFFGLAFNEVTLSQFEAIKITCSEQFSISDRFGLDLCKVLSSTKF